MMLYMTIGGNYLGFHREIGGPVVRAGTKGFRPVYSYAGTKEQYRIVEHVRGTVPTDDPPKVLDDFLLQNLGTGEMITIQTEFIGLAKSVGRNEFVV